MFQQDKILTCVPRQNQLFFQILNEQLKHKNKNLLYNLKTYINFRWIETR